jgi:hypothetical protein
MKRFMSILLGLACVAAATAAVALASDYKTKTTITATSDGYAGKVTSPKGACKKNRTVQVEFRSIGTRHPFPPTHTDGQGNWHVAYTTTASEYGIYVDVKAKSLGGGNTCKEKFKNKNFG